MQTSKWHSDFGSGGWTGTNFGCPVNFGQFKRQVQLVKWYVPVLPQKPWISVHYNVLPIRIIVV